jgi:hypothetical protein
MAMSQDESVDANTGTEDPFQRQMLSRQQYTTQPVGPVATGATIDYGTGTSTGAPAQTAPKQSAIDFIRQYQGSNPASAGIEGIYGALQGAGYTDVGRFMYGDTPSNNELVVNGQKFKVLGAEGTPGQYWYTGGDDSAPGSTGGGGTRAGAYTPGQGVAGMGTVFGGGGVADLGSLGQGGSIFDLLMQRARGGVPDVVVDPNDPAIKKQVESFAANQTRAERNYEAQLAERAGQHANIGMERRMGAEKIGQNTSAFEAQLMTQELQSRRQEVHARQQEIAQALAGAQGYLSQQQQAQLQRESMQLQEELAQLGLGQRAYEYDTDQQFKNSPLYGS